MNRTPFRRTVLAFAVAGVMALGELASPSFAAEDAFIIPPPAADVAPADGLKTFVLAGGCFWGVQGVYQHTKGVTKAVSGYAGGKADTAQYEIVGSGRTVVQVDREFLRRLLLLLAGAGHGQGPPVILELVHQREQKL